MTAALTVAARAGALAAAAVLAGVVIGSGEEFRVPSLVALLGGAVAAALLPVAVVPALLRLSARPCTG